MKVHEFTSLRPPIYKASIGAALGERILCGMGHYHIGPKQAIHCMMEEIQAYGLVDHDDSWETYVTLKTNGIEL